MADSLWPQEGERQCGGEGEVWEWLWNQTISLGGVYQRPRGLKSAFLQLMCFQVTSLRRQTTLGSYFL